jgi:hypothetical protein
MAVRNKSTGMYEATRTLRTGHQYTGVGATKEEAKEDLAKQLKEIEIDYGPYESESHRRNIQMKISRGLLPKYNPPMKQVGTVRSPGFEMKADEDGRYTYSFNADRTVAVLAKDLTAREASDSVGKE